MQETKSSSSETTPKASKRITIYDVAKAAGVAPSTVSRAFSRPGRVNSETGAMIRKVAKELGYHERPISRAETRTQTKVLAFVVADFANPVYSDLIRGFQKEAGLHGYTVLILDSQEDEVKERRTIEKILPMVDGVALTSSRMSDSSVNQIAKNKPVTVLNRQVIGVPSIVPDAVRGMRTAVEYLAELGHTKVTYISGPPNSWAENVRSRAIADACYQLNLTLKRTKPVAPSLQGGVEAVKQWSKSLTSAVIAYNDLMAIGFIKAIQKAGLRVPQDVSVVGVDNTMVSVLTTPSLTSVGPPSNSLGVAAAKSLISQITHHGSTDAPLMTVPMKLFTRDSTHECSAKNRIR